MHRATTVHVMFSFFFIGSVVVQEGQCFCSLFVWMHRIVLVSVHRATYIFRAFSRGWSLENTEGFVACLYACVVVLHADFVFFLFHEAGRLGTSKFL